MQTLPEIELHLESKVLHIYVMIHPQKIAINLPFIDSEAGSFLLFS